MDAERADVVIIGGGQAGLVTGYHLRRSGRSVVILDAHERIGDNWRERYDSLRLFTPTWASGLTGMPLPATAGPTATKDEMGDYLEAYAERFDLTVRTETRVDRLSRIGERYIVSTDHGAIEADHVVVATGAHRDARVPVMAVDLDPGIVQLHSSEYRNPAQLREGGVLVVGVGNSGADIALEVSATHPTWLSGPVRGHIPFDIDTWFSRNVAFRGVRFVGMHVLTLRTPMGRRAHAKAAGRGDPLVRVKPKQFAAAGIERVPKTVGVRDGLPVLEDGRTLDVTNVVWCVGFRHDLSWIELPIFREDGTVDHERGVVRDEPGLYLVGLPFQFAAASDVIPGVSRDAAFVAKLLLARSRQRGPSVATALTP
jgi:putative flavoprotein involved in K+ transport